MYVIFGTIKKKTRQTNKKQNKDKTKQAKDYNKRNKL